MEEKEVYNPQSGEKIAPKRPKKFWKDWRFYIYALIALMLGIVSVSSMVTACAAINDGVGTAQVDSSVSAPEFAKPKGLYYDSSFDYGTAGFGNYTGRPLDVTIGSSSRRLSENVNYSFSFSGTYGCTVSIPSEFSYQAKYNPVWCDFYIDGAYYVTKYISAESVTVEWSTAPTYVWIFENNSIYGNLSNGFYNNWLSANYSAVRGRFVNYTNNYLYLYSSASDSSEVDYEVNFAWDNPYNSIPVPQSTYTLYANMANIKLSYQGTLPSGTEPLFTAVDVYEDGEMLGTYKLGYNAIEGDYIPVDNTCYYWVFLHNNYSDAYQEGLSNGLALSSGFDYFTTTDVFTVSLDYMSPDSGYPVYYKLFDFYNSARTSLFSCYLIPMSGNDTDHLRIVVVDGGSFTGTESDILQVVAYANYNGSEYVGNSYLNYGAPADDYFVMGGKYNFGYVSGFYFNYIEVDLYQKGLQEGKEIGYNTGFAVGRVEGMNEADPESLTNTLVAVFQQPFNQIYRFFNFNFLGLNVLGLVTGILSIFLILKVLKKVK